MRNAWTIIGALLLAACGDSGGQAPAPPASLETNQQRSRQLHILAAVDVQEYTGPGGKPFRVAQRRGRITQYPCGACHDRPVVEERPGGLSRRWSHLDVHLEHAAALHCATCHRYEDLKDLRLIDGEPIDFDHSYLVCAQCHSQRARDWAGGAHGKRLGGWRGERVIENCTGCHDPHDPAFPRRMPSTYPQVPRTGGRR